VSWRDQYTGAAHGELIREQIRSDEAWRSGGREPAPRSARRDATG
jgi:hypothetical protein